VLTSTTTSIEYVGNDVLVAFATGFRFLAATDLLVTTTDPVTGVPIEQVLDVDYTVSGVDTLSSGLVTFTTAPVQDHAVKIQRVTARTQTMDLRNGGKFFAETVERAFDRVTMIAQEAGDNATPADNSVTFAKLDADLRGRIGTFEEITYSGGTLDLSFADRDKTLIVNLTAHVSNITFSDLSAGRALTVIFVADGTTRTLQWPAQARWLDYVILMANANKVAVVSLLAIGATNDKVLASGVAEQV